MYEEYSESGYTARHGPGAPSRVAISRGQAALIDAGKANQAIFGGRDRGRDKNDNKRDDHRRNGTYVEKKIEKKMEK